MKKIIVLIIIILSSCNKNNNYVSFKGKVINPNSDSLLIYNNDYKKTIKLNEDNSFSDTLNIKAGKYIIYDGKYAVWSYLKNGYDIEMNVKPNILDSDGNKISNFRESINFKGKGSDINNFLFEYNLRQSESGMNLYDQMMSLDSIGINTALDSINKIYIKEVSELTNDNHFLELETKSRDNFKKSYISFWNTKQEILKHNGKKSPYFNYENLLGGTTSIDDLKGKYLYIDIWATWCGPCKDEFPSFRKLEEKYHGLDYLDFVSISIDKITDRGKWIEMIDKEKLSGIHLLADKDWKSQYVIDNMIDQSGIPRYIIVDPKGYIVNSDAPRPSQEKKLYSIIDNLNNNVVSQ